MKRKVAYVVLGVFLMLGALYFIRYKRALVFENKIPSEATAILHVNVRQIEHHLLLDALQNPLKYINFKFSKKKKDSLRLQKIISIPKNLFFYTNDAAYRYGWFSSFLVVKDKNKLEQFLDREGYSPITVGNTSIFQKGKILMAIQDERLLVAFNRTSEQIDLATLKTIFKEVHFHSEQEDMITQLAASKSDVSYTTLENDFVEADFKEGLMEVSGTLNASIFLNDGHRVPAFNSVAYLQTKIDKEHRLFQSFITDQNSEKFHDLTKLSVDSIVDSWKGNLTFNLKSVMNQIDTIVTYDFDDDFNKVEKKSVQKTRVPDLEFSIETHTKLFKYLLNKNAIQKIDTNLIFTTIPLYKLYAHSTNDALKFSTTDSFTIHSAKNEYYKLNAYVNIEKYFQNPLEFSFLPSNTRYVQHLKEATIRLSENNELSAKLHLINSERNFIGQLLKP